MAHGTSRNFAALSWYAGASAPGSINVRPMHDPIPPLCVSLCLAISLSLHYSPPTPLSRSWEGLCPSVSVDLSCLRRNASFFPLACFMLRGNHSLADRDANHSIIAWPRRRKDQTGATDVALARIPPGNKECPCEINSVWSDQRRNERDSIISFTEEKVLNQANNYFWLFTLNEIIFKHKHNSRKLQYILKQKEH